MMIRPLWESSMIILPMTTNGFAKSPANRAKMRSGLRRPGTHPRFFMFATGHHQQNYHRARPFVTSKNTSKSDASARRPIDSSHYKFPLCSSSSNNGLVARKKRHSWHNAKITVVRNNLRNATRSCCLKKEEIVPVNSKRLKLAQGSRCSRAIYND